MPVHDWTRVDAGLFHAFHQRWISALCDAINTGGLPPDYFALPDHNISRATPDVLTVPLSSDEEGAAEAAGGLAVSLAPPRARHLLRLEASSYARRADRITVRHRHGDVVAIVEIVSPGNKGSKSELRAFVEKTADLIRQKVHVLVIDLFPPTKRDPRGIHKAIWDELEEEDFELPPDKPLILASYDAGDVPTAYVEPLGVGDTLPDMPLFLRPGIYVPAPLGATYQTTWQLFPAPMKKLLEGPPPASR
jgi:hypothetical protein